MKKSKFITDFRDIATPREKMPPLPLEERKESFGEVELGFEEERAIREAKRCLSCRRCIGCGLCLAECDPRAVVYDEQGRSLNLKVSAIVLTPGFDEFDAGRIRELGYRQFPNVVTSIELERMLSPTGPYGGFVLRPYDGDVPTRIAFVQCVGSRDEALGADYCSSICCMSAMREALSLVGQINDARVQILHRDIRPLGKGSEEFYQSVLKEPRVALVPAAVAKIEEVPESKNLVVEFSSAGPPAGSFAGTSAGSSAGSTIREEYDLVVLSVGVRPSATARALSRQAGVKLNKYGFCLTDALAPVLTNKAGIVAAGTFVGPADIEQSVCQAGAAAAVVLRSLKSKSLQPGETSRDTVSRPSERVLSGHGLSPNESPSTGASLQNISSSVLVIGSGVAGLTAALELSNLGHEVTVIEKEQEVGGVVGRFPLQLEARPNKGGSPGKSALSDEIASGETLVSSLIKATETTGNIALLTSTELAKFSGDVGRYSSVLRSNRDEKEATFGAVIVCTGGKEYVPEGFLYGKEKRVVTQFEFEKMLDAGASQASSVAMIQCVGSRSSDWPICARTCCEQALRNALKVKRLKPETRVSILHRDIRVYFVEEELFSEAKEKGVEFVLLKDSASRAASGSYVTVNAGEKMALAFESQASGARETISADYVVLSTGFRPPPGVAELASMLDVRIDDKGFFTEIHSKLRPVESSRKGIYICGSAHSPQTISETVAQAMAAAKKVSSLLKKRAAGLAY
jgi:heterodisulfide reductase subunit A-like polyferredoxin